MTEPPPICPGRPELERLCAGTVLRRIHGATFAPTAFNATIPGAFEGGRFDATPGDPHGVLYASDGDECAVAEALLRHVPLHQPAARLLPRALLANRRLSCIVAMEDLTLVKLYGSGLLQLGQTAWLTSAPAREYTLTRSWSRAIRSWIPGAAGFVWRSTRLNDRTAYVVFDDRCSVASFAVAPHPLLGSAPPGGHAIDCGGGFALVESILTRFGCAVGPGAADR